MSAAEKIPEEKSLVGEIREVILTTELTGCTSNLFSVDGHTCWKVRF